MNNFIKVLVCIILLGVIGVGSWLVYDKVYLPNHNNDTQQEQEATGDDSEIHVDYITPIVVEEGGAE